MSKSISVKSRSLRLVSVFVAVLLLCGWVRTGLAQESEVSLNAVLAETQKMSDEVDEMTLVWWVPEEFWWISFTQDPTVTEAETEEFVAVFRPYTLIVAADGTIGQFGGITYKSEADIRASIQIRDNQGILYGPLSEDKIDADAENLLSMMKPVLVNIIGPMGQNMHFFLFPAKTKKGQQIADAKKEGAFSVELGKGKFRWRLPLGSLLPLKMCPTCGEKLSGAYKFCPWDGTYQR